MAYKPPFLSSNKFLNILRYRYGNIRHAGFSGTLDPFAKGALIVAFGQYTKLFSYLKKSPKTYRATLWLGATSDTLDIEGVSSVENLAELPLISVQNALESLQGDQLQTPPKYSALRIDGKRAYKLAREGKEFEIARRKITVHKIALISYRHPFVSFECTVSEGTYVRSLALEIAQKLGTTGALSSLERVSEGAFLYDSEKPLDPLDFVDMRENFCTKSSYELSYGAKLTLEDMTHKEDGIYYIKADGFFVVVEIASGVVAYRYGAIGYV